MRFATLVLAVVALTVAAWAQDVTYNFDAQADFTKFKTYKWVEIRGGQQVDDLTKKQLMSALDAGLAAKGLTRTESDAADLYIGYQVALRGEQQLNAYNTGWGYGPGWRGGGSGMTTVTSSTIVVGTLALDMYESSKKDMVWRGTATKTLDVNAKPDKRTKNMQKGVNKLLKNYPPKK